MSRATRPIQKIDAQGYVIPYKASDSKLRIVYSTSTIRYYGVGRPGADLTANAWKIYRETVNASGNTIALDFVSGLNDFDNIWDDSVAVNISAITQASPGQITTTTAHGFVTGDIINTEDITGMVECNDIYYTITVVDTTKFTIGVDTTGFTPYVSGGKCYKRNYANYSFS